MDERAKQILEAEKLRREAEDKASAEEFERRERYVKLANVLDRFNGMHPGAFLSSIGRGDLWGIPPEFRAQWDEWRTDFCMERGKLICEVGWGENVLALTDEGDEARYVALQIMKAAVRGDRASVLAFFSSMPSGDDAKSLRVRSTMWLNLRMLGELEAGTAVTSGGDAVPAPVEVDVVDRPHWDRHKRVLTLDGKVIKQFKRPAENQFVVLDAFEELGWPAEMDDPLPRKVDVESTPEDRRRDTVKALNDGHESVLVAFYPTGSRIGWRLVN